MVIKKKNLGFIGLIIILFVVRPQLKLWHKLVFNKKGCWCFKTYDFTKAKFMSNNNWYKFNWNLNYNLSLFDGGDTAIVARTEEYSINKLNEVALNKKEYKVLDISQDTIVLGYLGIPYGNTINLGNNRLFFKDTSSIIWQIKYLVSRECPKFYKNYPYPDMSL